LDAGEEVKGAMQLGRVEGRVDLHHEGQVGAAQSALDEGQIFGLVPVLQRSIDMSA